MEYFFIFLAVCIVIYFVAQAGKGMELKEPSGMNDEELDRYIRQLSTKTSLCMKAKKYDEFDKYDEVLTRLLAEKARRKQAIKQK